MADFDLSKLKDNVGGIVGSLKSMISPASGVPAVDPDDALGLKIAELTTLVKQLTDAQNEHVKHLVKVNEMLNGVFHDVKTLREEVHGVRAKKAAEKPPETVTVAPAPAAPVTPVAEAKAVEPTQSPESEKKAE